VLYVLYFASKSIHCYAIQYTVVSVLVLGIGIVRGQYYWILDIGCLIWYRIGSNPSPAVGLPDDTKNAADDDLLQMTDCQRPGNIT